MVLHRLHADVEPGRHLGGGEAVGHELEDLLLPLGDERLLVVALLDLEAMNLVEHRRGQLGRQRGLALGRHAHRGHHFVGGAVLHEIAGRPGPDGLAQHGLVAVHGEDDDAGAGGLLADAARGLDAAHHRHGHVHEHDVGPVGDREVDRLPAVAGLADDAEALLLQRATQALAQHAVVVGQQQAHVVGLDHAVSSRQRTVVPVPGPESISSWAPMASARSRIPSMP